MYTIISVNPFESLAIIGGFLGLAITLYSIVASARDSVIVARWQRVEEAIDERREQESFVVSPFMTN